MNLHYKNNLIRCLFLSVVYLSALMMKGFSERYFLVKTAAWSWRERDRRGKMDGEWEESYSRTLAFVLDCVCDAGPAYCSRRVMLTHSV